MPCITLETYPPMDGEDYDEVIRTFTIPFRWLHEEYYQDNFGGMTLDEFLLEEYTWDDTLFIYERATTDKVIIKESIERR